MSEPDTLSTRYRSHVTDLADTLDLNDEAAFRAAFERLRGELNVELNPELRRLTDSARSALRRFRERARIDALAGQDVPDARKRLAHVVKLTNEAAHRTLDLIEQAGPVVSQWGGDAARLLEEWSAHGTRDLAVASLWPEQAHAALERSFVDAERVRVCLSEILQAQGYQDLTGQIIRSVIGLVGELESTLGQLVALANGEDTRRMPVLQAPVPSGSSRGSGPRIPGIDEEANPVGGQDDIDALVAGVLSGL